MAEPREEYQVLDDYLTKHGLKTLEAAGNRAAAFSRYERSYDGG